MLVIILAILIAILHPAPVINIAARARAF